MQNGVIFRYFSRYSWYSQSLASLLVFAVLGLAFLNTRLNFDLPVVAKTVPATASPVTGASNYLANLFHINNPTLVSDPAVDAESGVMRLSLYGGRFLYGHSSLGFSRLKTLYVGNTFTVTMDGETAAYRVVGRVVFNKSADLDGAANSPRRARIYSAIDESGVRRSLALMTCGNGANNDSNFRLVLYADRI